MKEDVLARIMELVGESPNVTVGSIGLDGYPHIKMMFNARRREGLHTFYFTTNTSSQRAREFSSDPRASLYFSDQLHFRGLMLKGRMEVLQEQSYKDMIWRDGDDVYYPLGVTDPDYCVFRFRTESGRYYSSFQSTDFVVSGEQVYDASN